MKPVDGYSKPLIDINHPLDELVDVAEKHLAVEPTVFQKSGELVCVTRDNDHRLVLRPLKSSIVRYLLSKVAQWVDEDKIIHPPGVVAKCLVDKTSWNTVRPLRALTTFPPLATDGSIIQEEGYHSDTRVFFTGDVECMVPERPTLRDAKRAVDTLLDIVCDFPFASDDHRSAWLAGLLSPLSRFCHDGNIPIVVIQANSPRVGKTTLVQLISFILTGSDCPVVTHVKSEDDQRKRILAYLRVGRSMVLVDNVVGEYGGASINALATSRTFEDRVLGQSKVIQVQNDTTWFITGNNILLAPDTAERCLNIRLRTVEEKPHLRNGFKYPDLWDTVRERRSELLTAALTILKAYIAADKPDMGLERWGSFEPWSRVVRSALVWAGLPDPAQTRKELEQDADVGRHTASALIEGWEEIQGLVGAPEGLTAREVYDFLSQPGLPLPRLRAAMDEITGGVGRLPNAHTIGRHLREIRDRNFNGKCLRCVPNEKTGHRWFVSEVDQSGDRGQGGQDSSRKTNGKVSSAASYRPGPKQNGVHLTNSR